MTNKKTTRKKATTRWVPIGDLVADDKNPRDHDPRNLAIIRESLDRYGQVEPLVVQASTMRVIGGNGRLAVLSDLGVEQVEIREVDLDDEQARALSLILNRSAETATWNAENLAAALDQIEDLDGFDADLFGFSDAEVEQLIADLDDDQEASLSESSKPTPPTAEQPEDPGAKIDRGSDLQKKWKTEKGQLWSIPSKAGDFDHRIVCGDSTDAEAFKRLMGDGSAALMVTDPPYCSGGFQEAGKKGGSVGTRGHELIHNDQLSSRGYQALLKNVLTVAVPRVAYIFTDWRMWISLFDVVESSGLGVRSMLVWDKGTPGMGRGWRNQHELIMVGARESQPFDPKKAQGNVIQSKRTGNKLHATEKPVDLIETILTVTDMHAEVYDPFLGSGTTLVAAERLGRRVYGFELDPCYCAVALERAAGLGLKPRKMDPK